MALDNEFITVECDPDAGIVQHVMHRFVISAMFRQGLELGLTLMRDHGATKWLSDDRRNSAISNDDVEWARTRWQPRAVTLGLRYWAIVVPEDVLGGMRIRRIAEAERGRGLTIELFSDPDAARAWLQEVPGQRK